VDFFENYAIVAMQSDKITFYACKIIKVQFEKNKFFHQVAPTSEKQLKYFSYTKKSTTLMPTGPHRNDPLSSNLVVWCAKIGFKTKKH
jgi:hypothetical protein